MNQKLRGARLFVAAVLIGTSAFTVPFAGAESPYEALAEQVEIRRTEYGVPHIKAETLEAVAFGLGYCQAEDHCVTIMEHILTARGEMAKVFGGEDNLERDIWNRQFRVRARAVETFHKLDADFRSMLDGFAAGFSYYVELHREELPDWVQPITAHDVAAHGMTGVMRFAFNRGNVVRGLKRSLEGEETAQAFDLDGTIVGSNMWAFAPSRTKSGNAILMGNPHQPWSKVATYYEAHLTVPGEIDFYGSTFIGRPVLTTGFNRHLGWSHTVNYPDLEEIYALEADPANPDHYLFDGGSIPLRKEVENFEVRRPAKDGGESVEEHEETFWHSPLGPVIHRTDDTIYVLKSVAYDEFRFYQQWLRLAQSKNFDEFREALEIGAIPMFNICYADREGNIFYLWNGAIPDIPHANKGAEAVPARSSSEVWTRVHPVSELPQLLNPEGGYVHNCNSPPYFTNLHEPLKRESYPPHFPDNRFSLRSQASIQLIHNDTKFSLEEVRDMKFDPRMVLADRVKDDLIAQLEKADGDEFVKAIGVLKKWDNTVRAEARGAVVFAEWWDIYSDDNDDPFRVPWSETDPVETPRGLPGGARAVEDFRAAMAQLTKTYGTWDLKWGDVHRVVRGDVDLPASGGGGDLGCFRVLRFKEEADGRRVVNSGDSWIFTVEFGDEPKAYTVVGYSQSGHPDSPHYNDQTVLYAKNRMKRAAFTEREIEKQSLVKYRPGESRR